MEDVLADLGLPRAGRFDLTGDPRPAVLSSPLPVADCAIASVGACLGAAAELALARTGRLPEVTLDTGQVAAAMRAEFWLRDSAGRGVEGFAPLSRLWRTGAGWVRTHANYPWHRAALLAALDLADGPDDGVRPLVEHAMAQRAATEVEEVVYRAGGLAVAARSRAEWQAAAGAGVTSASPLVAMAPLGVGAPARSGAAALPASGVRVLDLTRVIAGPVGTRMLAALGADVLRIDDPRRPELPLHAVDGVIGKASAAVDLRTAAGGELLHHLADQADVIVTGYRPGALARFGLEPEQIADRHPGTIVATLSAWGEAEGWTARRGFDSLVQIATGIGWATSADGERPGSLPCQMLDHAAGYLLAAGVLEALTRRARTGESTHVAVSLARVAQWLLDQGPVTAVPPSSAADAEAQADAFRTDLGGGWSGISPPGRLDGRALTWPHLPPTYGRARPGWD
ncbi:CoA transferase [Mangrovihabitans endophyticus]|uniref:CoA transferase n=1 Tax=Mangrovihabitans endophyticus TaxID=1751298 RepID=A0A8J3BXN1_9ACTN|nr:CoA transferase [Mangrovihabitans endophyticus]